MTPKFDTLVEEVDVPPGIHHRIDHRDVDQDNNIFNHFLILHGINLANLDSLLEDDRAHNAYRHLKMNFFNDLYTVDKHGRGGYDLNKDNNFYILNKVNIKRLGGYLPTDRSRT